MTTDPTRGPWPAPKPPTRSLAWPAPTCETPSRLPDGTRVRTPNGSTGVIEGHDSGKYDVFSAADGQTYQLTDRDITPSRITGSGYPEGFLERFEASGTMPAIGKQPRRARKGDPIRHQAWSDDGPQTEKFAGVRKGRIKTSDDRYPMSGGWFHADGSPVKWARRLRIDKRKLLAFGTSLLGYDITKLMDPPKRGGKAHSKKCQAGRKGAKGGPGFIKADPRCPACKPKGKR